MLSIVCWVWLFTVLTGFFLVPVTDPDMEHRHLAALVFGSALVAAIFLATR